MGNTQCGTKRPPLYEEAGPLEVRSFDVTVPEGYREGTGRATRFTTVAGPYALLVLGRQKTAGSPPASRLWWFTDRPVIAKMHP